MSTGTRASGDRGGVLRLALPLVLVGGMVALWEAVPLLGWVRPQSVPRPTAVLPAAGAVLTDPDFLRNLLASGRRWVLGVLIAATLGTAVGLAMGRSRRVERLLDPLLVMMYPVPKVALVLLLVLWFGTGDLTRITVIVLGTCIPIVIAAFHAAADVEPRLLWSARSLGTGRRAALRKVVLPAALPGILAGGRIAISISIFTVLASELLIRESGAGAYLFNRLDVGADAEVWATGLILAGLGVVLDLAYVTTVRRALRWWDGEV